MIRRMIVGLVAMLAVGVVAGAYPSSVLLNGEWQTGLSRKYTDVAVVPSINMDPEKVADASVWFKREVVLPEGDWNGAVLELKGARFRPKVYVNGKPVGSSEGGMIRTLIPLSGLISGTTITLEIELASLKDVPKEDSSYIPGVDQWRSNCSSCLWDDVVMHFYKDAWSDRILTFYNKEKSEATLRYRVNGTASTAKIVISGAGIEPVELSGPAVSGENEVTFNTKGLKEWSPNNPTRYSIEVNLLDPADVVLYTLKQAFGLKTTGVDDDKHFTLNGERIRLLGGSVVWHRWVRDENARELAYDTDWFEKNIMQAIKKRGGNYLRFHLGVPPERMLDLCDSLGLAVQYEWNFFHGLPASYESLVEQWGLWLDMASRHPSIYLYHPYNETDDEELVTAWKALDHLIPQYPDMVLEDRDLYHIHRYWWGMSENIGLYYDSYKQFKKAIMVDEFGGIYLDENAQLGGYPRVPESMKRWLGANHTEPERLHQQEQAAGKIGEYWRRMGAAGVAVFPIASSFEDGNNWFMGDLREGNPKSVWDRMTVVWADRTVSMDVWDRNFTPRQKVRIPLHLINDTGKTSLLKAKLELKTLDGKVLRSKRVRARVKPGETIVRKPGLRFPKAQGDYILTATLLNPSPGIEYPVESKWEVRVIKSIVPAGLKDKKIYIPSDEKELVAMAERNRLKLSSEANDADLILLGGKSFSGIDNLRGLLDSAIVSGKSVVMLEVGDRGLGKAYNDDADSLGSSTVAPKIKESRITATELFAGITLNSVEVAEPESHLHPGVDSSLWNGLPHHYGYMWNGLRGGLIVPAFNMEVIGLSQDAYLADWVARGADPARIKGDGHYYAYEYCGFYRFSDSANDSKAEESLRQQVAFLVEDMPALRLSLPRSNPIRVTDLVTGYKNNEGCRVSGFSTMAVAGKNLVRTPVVKISFGEGEGNLILCQLLTEGRLAPGYAAPRKVYPAAYDEMAVQFILNMLNSVSEPAIK